MIINDVELTDIDKYDYETAKKVEDAMESLKGISDEVKGLKQSKSIEIQCKAINNLFDTIFGEGTSEKVFKNKMNLKVSFFALEKIVDYVSKEDEEFKKITNKYTPNRAARRK